MLSGHNITAVGVKNGSRLSGKPRPGWPGCSHLRGELLLRGLLKLMPLLIENVSESQVSCMKRCKATGRTIKICPTFPGNETPLRLWTL